MASAREASSRPASTFSIACVPEARPDNNFLGFCRGAWNLQNGDRAAAMQQARQGRAFYFQKCREPKCAFRSAFVSADADLIWTQVFEFAERGIKLRWTFLAKSHVPQRLAVQNKHSYKCLFCVYQGARQAAIHSGMDAYLDHITSEHRGKDMDLVLQYKARCLNNSIADDGDHFDINLWPSNTTSRDCMKVVSTWLSDGSANRSAWSDLEGNPWAETTASGRPEGMQSPVPTIPPRSQLRLRDCSTQESLDRVNGTSSRVTFLHSVQGSPSRCTSDITLSKEVAFARTTPAGGAVDTITACLNDILQVYIGSLQIMAGMSQQATRNTRIPPDPLLRYTISDNTVEIEKLRQRGITLFGPSFGMADDNTVNTLQRVSRQLYSGLFKPLSQAAEKPNFNTYAPLAQAVEHSQREIVQILKQRLSALQAEGRSHPQRPQSLQSPCSRGYSHCRSCRSPALLLEDVAETTPSHISEDNTLSERLPSTAPQASNTPPVAPTRVRAPRRRRNSFWDFFKHSARPNQY